MSNITTVNGGRFPVQDITFHGARSQSEVEKEQLAEIGVTNTDRPTPVPKSMTPEQLVYFYEDCCSKEPDRAKLYAHTVKVIKEYDRLLKESRTLKAQIVRLNNDITKLKNGEDLPDTKEDADEL